MNNYQFMIIGKREFLSYFIKNSKVLRTILNLFFPIGVKKILLYENFLSDYILNYYPEDSIKERKFYNIGAGNQRSKNNIWSYIDLADSKYSKNQIDVFYDLESLAPISLPNNYAEVVFNSFVIEHISIAATKNLCDEAFRILKKGGVFHSKVHCYDYSYRLWNHGLLDPMVPFEGRESSKLINDFISKHKGKVNAGFDNAKNYVVKSTKNPSEQIVFSPATGFLYHNAVAAIDNILSQPKSPNEVLSDLNGESPKQFYKDLKELWIDDTKKKSFQHNADYFSKEDLFDYIKSLGFSEVYFTQPYQSISPALWEDSLNPIHKGFLFAIEAVK